MGDDMERIRKRHPKIEQDPLFDLPPGAAGKPAGKPFRVPSIRTAKCPHCKASNKAVGVIRDGNGLEVFRDHDKFTVGGRRIPCNGSGTEAPPDTTSNHRGGWTP